MRSLAVASAALVTCLAACATDHTAPSTGSDGGIVAADATSVQIHITGGLAPTPAAGSTCQPMDDLYTYTIATRVLAWTTCTSATGDNVFAEAPGSATLDAASADQLHAALLALAPEMTTVGGDITARLAYAAPSGSGSFIHIEQANGYSDVMDVVYSFAP
jgi:hypothetical protein|nr:hypothetical protein [Kofleriaceae bacterium]